MKNVYFIQRGGDGPIKIGSTRGRPSSRLVAIQVGSAERLRLLGYLRDDESRVHALFRQHRIGGEWFHPHQDILNFVRYHTTNEDPKRKRIREKNDILIGLRLKKPLHERLLSCQKEAKRLSGFGSSIHKIARVLIERGLEANGKKR